LNVFCKARTPQMLLCFFFRSISAGYNSFLPLSPRSPLPPILQPTSRTRHVERDGSHAMTAKGPHTL